MASAVRHHDFRLRRISQSHYTNRNFLLGILRCGVSAVCNIRAARGDRSSLAPIYFCLRTSSFLVLVFVLVGIDDWHHATMRNLAIRMFKLDGGVLDVERRAQPFLHIAQNHLAC